MEDDLRELEHGPVYAFAAFDELENVVPKTGAGVYMIWDSEACLVYVGVSGRSSSSKTGPWGRLRSHARGRRSGDQFCVYVADRYVLPRLTQEDIGDIAQSRLSMDGLVRQAVHELFRFRFVAVADYLTALGIEKAIKGGALDAGPPSLNP